MAFKIEKKTPEPLLTPKKKGGAESLLHKEIKLFPKKLRNKHKEPFYSELGVLLQAGVNLRDALAIISDGKEGKPYDVFNRLSQKIVAGESFSNALLGEHDFSEYEYHSIKIGEETGLLHKIATELGVFYAKKNTQRRNLIGALSYPVVILVTALGVVGFMLRFVVPMFKDIFAQNQVELPGITRMVISVSDSLNRHGGWLLFMVLLVFLLRFWLSKKEAYKKRRDRLIIKLPFFKDFFKTYYLAQFTHAVSLLSASRVPITQTLELVRKMLPFYPLREALHTAILKIHQGHSLSESLEGSGFFDKKLIALVKVSEETNQTDFIFAKLHRQYAEELEHRSKMLSTLLEPFIILALGVFVGLILVALYLPMFKISSVI